MTNEMLSNHLKFQVIWDAMRQINLPEISVSFSGSGDSGQVDDVGPDFGPDFGLPYLSGNNTLHVAANARWTACTVTLGDTTLTLAAHCENVANGLLNETPDVPDWYNDDGGRGTVTFTLDGETIEMEVNQAQVSYDTTMFEFDKWGNERDDEEEPEVDAADEHEREQQQLLREAKRDAVWQAQLAAKP